LDIWLGILISSIEISHENSDLHRNQVDDTILIDWSFIDDKFWHIRDPFEPSLLHLRDWHVTGDRGLGKFVLRGDWDWRVSSFPHGLDDQSVVDLSGFNIVDIFKSVHHFILSKWDWNNFDLANHTGIDQSLWVSFQRFVNRRMLLAEQILSRVIGLLLN